MKRSWAFLFYDLALFALLVLPLSIALALLNGRSKAAAIYSSVFLVTLVGVALVTRCSKLSIGNYWRALSERR